VRSKAINLTYDVAELKRDDADRLLAESLHEIDECRALSIGPTLLCLVGDEYGDPLLPPWFERDTFELLIECLREKKGENHRDVKALLRAYSLNKNFLNNRYEKQLESVGDRHESLLDFIRLGMQTAIGKGLLAQSLLDELNQSSRSPFTSH
jgi:hypothetical protein